MSQDSFEASAAPQTALDPLARLEACLARLVAFEPRTQAWVVIDEPAARRQAERLAELARRGQPIGPLAGMVIGVKDIIDVAGLPTRAGSSLTSDQPARSDATVVARLRAAGGVILGKTVTTEWACFDPPPTANPWDDRCTPGGSSSGSAAAVALGMCDAALGSQTGGSITRPAAYCGVAGLKPTFGRVSRRGVLPLSPSLDHVGPLARCVRDLALVLSAIAGPDPLDPACSAEPAGDFTTELDRREPVRLGWIEPFFMTEIAPDARVATVAAVEQLRAAGGSIERVALPLSFADVHALHYQLMAHEAAQVHRQRFSASPERFGPRISSLLRDGAAVSAEQRDQAALHQTRFRDDILALLAGFDALLTPAADGPPPADRGTTGNPRFNSPWSFAGLPTVSIPCGLTASGLPVGLQLIGRVSGESALLGTAAWCERAIGFVKTPYGCRGAS